MPLFSKESPEVFSAKFVRVSDTIHLTPPHTFPDHDKFAREEGLMGAILNTSGDIQDEDLDAGEFQRYGLRVLFTSASSTLGLPINGPARFRTAEIFQIQNPEFEAFIKDEEFRGGI